MRKAVVWARGDAVVPEEGSDAPHSLVAEETGPGKVKT